jgi:hypothetical protein
MGSSDQQESRKHGRPGKGVAVGKQHSNALDIVVPFNSTVQKSTASIFPIRKLQGQSGQFQCVDVNGTVSVQKDRGGCCTLNTSNWSAQPEHPQRSGNLNKGRSYRSRLCQLCQPGFCPHPGKQLTSGMPVGKVLREAPVELFGN